MEAKEGILPVITCRAVVAWGPGEPLVMEEVQVDPPRPLEIRVKVVRSSLCRSDLNQWESKMNTELLKLKAEMLLELFCIQIDKKGYLLRLPVVLDQYIPDMDRIPEFFLSLANDDY